VYSIWWWISLGMLLRYVTDYVTKSKDNYIAGGFVSEDTSGADAAFRYITELHPSEPEMWLSLSGVYILQSLILQVIFHFEPIKFYLSKRFSRY